MKSKSLLFLCLSFFIVVSGCKQFSIKDKNWTHFRGTNLNSIAENENIPLIWDESVIKWKTEIHDKGYSSPVVYKDQIWLTTGKDGGEELYAVCLDFETGKIIYDIKVFFPEEVERRHSLNTYASPTPCIEKGFVYVHYGSMGTACINTETGEIMWKRTDLKCKHIHGPGSSPVIYNNLLILHFEGVEERYIVALDKSNGELVWRTDRPADLYEPLPTVGRLAYLTPIIINVEGRYMLISNGSASVWHMIQIPAKKYGEWLTVMKRQLPCPLPKTGYYSGTQGSMSPMTAKHIQICWQLIRMVRAI